MAAMVRTCQRLRIGLVGRHLSTGGKRQAVVFLQNLSSVLLGKDLLWTGEGPGSGFLSSKITFPADQWSP
jgi:hypothetical protein